MIWKVDWTEMESRKGNGRVSVRQKEFAGHLAEVNCRRALYSGILLAVVLPLFCGVCRAAGIGMGGKGILTMVIILEAVQLIALPAAYLLLKRNERDRMFFFYRGYYSIVTAGLLVLSAMEYRQTGSMVLLVAAAAFYVMIPALSKKEQKAAAALMTAAAAVFCVTAIPAGARGVVDAAIVLALGVILGRYSQENTRHLERMRNELREKTISSEHDPLTGLMNRRGLGRRAEVLWPYCARSHAMVGIIAIDIDFFKKYNDKFGHPEGDQCLKKIADAIRNSARRGTDITARTGGEEFLVFVQDMTGEEMISLALKIRSKVAELKIPHAYVGVSKYVTVSMGLAYDCPDGGGTFQQLYEQADQALYTAKENGRNCIVSGNLVYGRMKNGLGTVING